jgi:hypothetical protein
MARHTRIKLAALATTLVAALGILAVPAAAGQVTVGAHDRIGCC